MFRSSLAQRFAVTVDVICLKIGNHIGLVRTHVPVLAAAYHRLRRMLNRLDRLALLMQAGLLPVRRPSRPRQAAPRGEAAAVAAAAAPESAAAPEAAVAVRLRMPSRDMWLIRLVQPTAQLQEQVANLVADPETLALAAVAPQTGRLLRPLCRMLGVTLPEALRLPPRPRRPRPRQDLMPPGTGLGGGANPALLPGWSRTNPPPLSGPLQIPWRLRLRVPGLLFQAVPVRVRRRRYSPA